MDAFEKLQLFSELTLEQNVGLLKRLTEIDQMYVVFFNGIGLDTRYRFDDCPRGREVAVPRNVIGQAKYVRSI